MYQILFEITKIMHKYFPVIDCFSPVPLPAPKSVFGLGVAARVATPGRTRRHKAAQGGTRRHKAKNFFRRSVCAVVVQ
jgi:hypothetical protein